MGRPVSVIVDAEYVTRAIEDAIATLLQVVPETGFVVIAIQTPDAIDLELAEKNGVVALPAIIRSTVPPEIAVVAMRSISAHIERTPPSDRMTSRSKG